MNTHSDCEENSLVIIVSCTIICVSGISSSLTLKLWSGLRPEQISNFELPKKLMITSKDVQKCPKNNNLGPKTRYPLYFLHNSENPFCWQSKGRFKNKKV